MKSFILTICTAYIITVGFTQVQGFDCTTGNTAGGTWSCPDLTDANIHQAIMNRLHDPAILDYGPIEKWKTDKLTNFACFFATENGECNDLHMAHGLTKWDLERDSGPSRADLIKLFNADLSAWDTSGVKFIISCTDHMSSTLCVADNDCKWEDDSCELKVESHERSIPGSFFACFSGATKFDRDLSGWDMSGATDISLMFGSLVGSSIVFNGDVSSWDVSSVKQMDGTFQGCQLFNQDLSNWNVGKVITMESTFYRTAAFNSDISGWNVSSIQKMPFIFEEATAFNRDLSKWDISHILKFIPGPTKDEEGNPIEAVPPPLVGMFSGASSLDQIFCSEAWLKQKSFGTFSFSSSSRATPTETASTHALIRLFFFKTFSSPSSFSSPQDQSPRNMYNLKFLFFAAWEVFS